MGDDWTIERISERLIEDGKKQQKGLKDLYTNRPQTEQYRTYDSNQQHKQSFPPTNLLDNVPPPSAELVLLLHT